MEFTAMEVRVIQLYMCIPGWMITDPCTYTLHAMFASMKPIMCAGGVVSGTPNINNVYPPCISHTVCSNMQNKALWCIWHHNDVSVCCMTSWYCSMAKYDISVPCCFYGSVYVVCLLQLVYNTVVQLKPTEPHWLVVRTTSCHSPLLTSCSTSLLTSWLFRV